MWFFRAVQRDDGQWVCRRGLHEFDTHELLDSAVEHLLALASDFTPFEVYVHHLDGTVESRSAPTSAGS